MRYFKIAMLAGLSALMFVACVSRKKFDQAQHQKDEIREELSALRSEYADLKKEKQLLEKSTSAQLNYQEKQLVKISDALDRRDAYIERLQQEINQQRYAVNQMHAQVCSALKCFTPEELTIDVRDGKLYVSMSDKLLFAPGSDQIGKKGIDALDRLAAVIDSSDLVIMVEGHTDSMPIHTMKYNDNWDLSVHRATTVTRILIEKGIEEERIIAAGRSYYVPVASNETAKERQLNRRTEIVLAPKLDKLWELTEAGEDAFSTIEQ